MPHLNTVPEATGIRLSSAKVQSSFPAELVQQVRRNKVRNLSETKSCLSFVRNSLFIFIP